MTNLGITVFFPVRNEEKSIRKCLEETIDYLKSRKLDYEVIVVNDGSTDNTCDEIKEFTRINPRVILINTNGRKGYGAAVKKGLVASTKEFVFFTDADLQYDIDQLDSFLKEINNYDYLIGSRQNLSTNTVKKIILILSNFLIKYLLGLKAKDVGCDFMVFKRDVIKDLNLTSNTGFINAEIIYKLEKRGFRFKNIPINHYYRKFGRDSIVGGFSVISLTDIVKLKLNLSK